MATGKVANNFSVRSIARSLSEIFWRKDQQQIPVEFSVSVVDSESPV